MQGAGFEVINLGINNPVESCLKAIAATSSSSKRKSPPRGLVTIPATVRA